MLTAKVTDDILVAGPIPALNDFATNISQCYIGEMVIVEDEIQFNCCEIS